MQHALNEIFVLTVIFGFQLIHWWARILIMKNSEPRNNFQLLKLTAKFRIGTAVPSIKAAKLKAGNSNF